MATDESGDHHSRIDRQSAPSDTEQEHRAATITEAAHRLTVCKKQGEKWEKICCFCCFCLKSYNFYNTEETATITATPAKVATSER